MLTIDPAVLTRIAKDKGWIHESGRLRGTINASKMACGLGVAKSTVTRAYDGGAAGITLLERLRDVSGVTLDKLVIQREDEPAAALAEGRAA